MSMLKKLEATPPSLRNSRIGQAGIERELCAIERKDAINWLESNIASPVGPDWGRVLVSLNPDWIDFKRWITMSKEHCLAAIDALDNISHKKMENDAELKLPEGASVDDLLKTLNNVIERYSTPRVIKAVESIKRIWESSEGKIQPNLPASVIEFAKLLLFDNANVISKWLLILPKEYSQPFEMSDIWSSLMSFCERKGCIAIIDWKQSISETASILKELPTPVPIKLSNQIQLDSDLPTYFKLINESLANSSVQLVLLDDGSDSYSLIFMSLKDIPRAQRLVSETFGANYAIRVFD